MRDMLLTELILDERFVFEIVSDSFRFVAALKASCNVFNRWMDTLGDFRGESEKAEILPQLSAVQDTTLSCPLGEQICALVSNFGAGDTGCCIHPCDASVLLLKVLCSTERLGHDCGAG